MMNTKQQLLETATATAKALGPRLGNRLPELPKLKKPKGYTGAYDFWSVTRALELDRSLQNPALPRVKIQVGGVTYHVLADSRSLETFAKRVKKLPQSAFDEQAEPIVAVLP
jgi:hypothetical protein